jgi:hypothetical protein
MVITIQPPTPQHNPELERQYQLERTVTRLDAGLTLLVLLEQSSPATLSEFDPMGIGYSNVPYVLELIQTIKGVVETAHLEAIHKMTAQTAYNTLLEELQAPPAAPLEPVATTPAPLEVGEILVYSWGYEQTNIDFYQVVSATGKTVMIREIKSEVTQNTPAGMPNSMTAREIPMIDTFIGDSIRKTPKVWAYNGEVYLKMKHGFCKRWNGRPQHSSSYA